MIYKWKFDKYPVNAQVAGEYLSELEKKNNGLKPADVVEASMDENSVLHECFEWDNDKAADQYRIDQARDIIRHIVVTKSESNETHVRAFFSITTENEKKHKYLSLQAISENEDYKKQTIDRALRELVSFKQKYADLKDELGLVFNAIEKAAEQLRNTA